MKYTLTVVIAFIIFAASLANEAIKNESAFVHTLKKLQRGPPTSQVAASRAVKVEWITQKLDNFNNTNEETWQMRYMVNDQYFEEGGPMFIFVGGEWEIDPYSITKGLFVDLVKKHKGILFYTEHRFYGASRPTDNLLLDSLKFLHVKQALADLAEFIKTKRTTVPGLSKSKVILSGCSYSATMVVWFKRLYPDLLAGGWASSAPIFAKVNFFEYSEVVGQSMRELGSDQCYDRIQRGVAELETIFMGKRSAEGKALLKLCNNFDHNNDLDIWSLFGSISNIFSGIAQYQSGDDVPLVCDYLMSFKDDLTAIATFWLKAFQFPSRCIDATYKGSLDDLIDSTYINGAARPWYYQTCNEYGWYQSSASVQQPFGSKFPALFYTTLCADVYGSKYSNEYINQMAAETNDFFGGMNPQVENIYMTHGGLDPWHTMGHGELEGAAMIPQASHCSDMDSISSSDSPEMRATKERLMELVAQWLA